MVRDARLTYNCSDEFPEMEISGYLVPIYYRDDNALFTLYPEGDENV